MIKKSFDTSTYLHTDIPVVGYLYEDFLLLKKDELTMADAPYSSKRLENNNATIALSTLMALTNSNENVRIAVASILALITKESLGLGNVNNTADMDKPISTLATQAFNSINSSLSSINLNLQALDNARYIDIDGTPVLISTIVEALRLYHNDDLHTLLQAIVNNLINPEQVMYIAISGIKSDLTETGIGASYINRLPITVTGVYIDVSTTSLAGDLSVMMKINGINAFTTPIFVVSGSLSQPAGWVFSDQMPNKIIAAGDRVEFDILTTGQGVRGAVATIKYRTNTAYTVPAIAAIP